MSTIGSFKAAQADPVIAKDDWLVLSLTQPWASALFEPVLKRIETRGWRTNYRGRLYIHASKAMPRYAKEFHQEIREMGYLGDDLPLGAILGHVTLVDIVSTTKLSGRISKMEEMFGDYGERRWGWITKEPVLLQVPIRATGQLGLWSFKSTEAA